MATALDDVTHCKPIVVSKKYARSSASSVKRTRGHPSYVSALGGCTVDKEIIPPNTSECFDNNPGYTRNTVELANRTIVPSAMYNSGCRFHPFDSGTLDSTSIRSRFLGDDGSEDDSILECLRVERVNLWDSCEGLNTHMGRQTQYSTEWVER